MNPNLFSPNNIVKNISFFLSIVFMVSCSDNKSVNPVEISVDAQEVQLTKKQFEALETSLISIEPSSFSKTIAANGLITIAPENNLSVSTYFGGSVKELKLLSGQSVEKGQVLFTLENPEFIEVQQAFLEIKSQLSYLFSDFERQKALVKDKIASEKNYLKAESEYKVALAKFKALSKKLYLMHIDTASLSVENLKTEISILSPISGFVTEVNILKGEFLSPSQKAVGILSTQNLMVELKVFESDIYNVKIGDTIEFKLLENPALAFKAALSLINKSIDLNDRTIKVQAKLPNLENDIWLYPGMYVEANIIVEVKNAFALPKSAVVELNQKNYVLQLLNKTDSNYIFIKSEVSLGNNNEEKIEILNASQFNDKATFLTKGAFNLITE